VDPVPDPLLFFLVVPGIEPGPPDLQPRTLTTRPRRRSPKNIKAAKFCTVSTLRLFFLNTAKTEEKLERKREMEGTAEE
jgi:hypothetical protein